MPVFISYSHQDKMFAEKLASQLVFHKAKVWLDTWELHVGDSLIEKIQEAISGASALLIVLSKSSVQSQWCKKELSSGLIRELEEKRVVVLPILIEDCEIPLFLRDKLYADFRENFDSGLQITLESIAKITSNALGRYDQPEYHVDWSIDWLTIEDRFCLRLTLVEHGEDQPHCVLTEIRIIGDETATKRVIDFVSKGQREYSHYEVVSLLHREISIKDFMRVRIDSEFPQIANGNILCLNPERAYDVQVSSRRLGQDTGRDILLDTGGQVSVILKTLNEVNKPDSDLWDKEIESIQSNWIKSSWP